MPKRGRNEAESSPPINLVRGYPLVEMHQSGVDGDPSRHSTLKSGGADVVGVEYPTVRSGRSGRFAIPPPALGPLTAEPSAASRSRPTTLERRRAAAAETEGNAENPRTLERRPRRERDSSTERRLGREEEALALERQLRREAEAAEERARERLYEPPIIHIPDRTEGRDANFFHGGNRNTLDRNLKSFSAPSRR